MGTSFTAVNDNQTRDSAWGPQPVTVTLPEEWCYFSWNIGAARAVLTLLGLANEYLVGDVSLPQARRAVMTARAKFDRDAHAWVRQTTYVYGKPTENDDGTIELRPVRAVLGGLSLDDMRRRLNDFSTFIEVCAAAGATRITWG